MAEVDDPVRSGTALRDKPGNNMFKNIFEYVQEHILICSGIIDAMKDVGHRADRTMEQHAEDVSADSRDCGHV